MSILRILPAVVCVVVLASAHLDGGEATPAERGYRHLLEKPYVPAYFDQETLDAVWQVWPEPLREKAAKAPPAQRRAMAFRRYGLTPRPGDDSDLPLQFVVSGGQYYPNCFTCHGGSLLGKPMSGAPNTDYALQTLIDETGRARKLLGKRPNQIDVGAMFIPLGGSNGTTNAVIFGVALGRHRNPDLTLKSFVLPEKLLHHDMDAPPWWHFKKKKKLYIDGFAGKSHRTLMQFALDRSNGREKFLEWESDFRDIYAYLESIEPPKYRFEIDDKLAARGRELFGRTCSRCHGTYGEKETYPHKVVPIEEIGTDRARFDALTRRHREEYRKSWLSHHGQDGVVLEPKGYMAPPLDGVWASAPYFHNGSVPTLWHVLRPDRRPIVWKRSEAGYDREKVGLQVRTFDALPESVNTAAEQRTYFDTRQFSKSASGHHYPDALSEDEKQAVLEYLKTL